MPKYETEKIAISLDRKLLNKLDKVKEYPKWRGNRSLVIDEALREFLNNNTESKCIFCGCTDSRACEGGCHWILVDRKSGLGVCSECSENNDIKYLGEK